MLMSDGMLSIVNRISQSARPMLPLRARLSRWTRRFVPKLLLAVIGLGLLASPPAAPSNELKSLRHVPLQLCGNGFAERLEHAEVGWALGELGFLVREHQQRFGRLPQDLRELEDVMLQMPQLRLLLFSSFYLILDDRFPNYRFLYRPHVQDSLVVALPREQGSERLTMAYDLENGWTAVGTLGSDEVFGNIVGSLPPLGLHLRFPGEADKRVRESELAAFHALREIHYAQLSHRHLFGQYAGHLHELTEPKLPARLPLAIRDLREGRVASGIPENYTGINAGYRIELFAGEAGWRATADPWPGTRGYRYRFRVKENGLVEFASVGQEDWQPISVLR